MEETVKRLYLAAQKLRNITSPSDLARLLNASPQTLKNWETRGISKAGLIDAAKILDINIQWLETGYGEMRQPETG